MPAPTERTPVTAIDMHAHFWPFGLLRAIGAGESWYGWVGVPDLVGGGTHLSLDGRPVRFDVPDHDLDDAPARDAERQGHQGITSEALMVVGFLWNYHLDAARGARQSREVNEELAALQAAHPARYRGLAVLPLQDTRAAIDELEYAVKELGLTSFAIGGHVGGRNLDDAGVVPVLEAMADADVSISVHPPYFGKIGGQRLDRHHFSSSLAAPVEASISLMSVIHSGLLDRRPDIRMWFTHGGGIVPFTIGRFRTKWARLAPEDRPMRSSPEDYLRRVHVGCLVHDDASLRFLIDRVGIERVTLGTDHPFDWDHPGGAANWIRSADFLTDEEREAILWGNAVRFLRWPEAAPQPHA